MTHLLKVLLLALPILLGMGVPFGHVSAADDEVEVLYWVAPMDANYRRDKAGKSPMGMDLVPVYAGAEDEGTDVKISPEVIQNLGIRTAVVERSRLWRGISTVGYVNFDESRLSHIHLRTAGWIEKLTVKSEGERVKKGQRLFNVYSPELVNAQEEYVQALGGRSKRLRSASRDRLKALGISNSQIKRLERDKKVHQTVAFYAPQDGVVSSLPVREGMYVKPSKRVMALADLSSVWLIAEVFEKQANWVKVGNPAEVKLSFVPGRIWEGLVEYIYPSLDAKTRALKVRLRFDNADEALKPNMYAQVKIFGGARDNILTVPIEAVIRSGEEDRLIIAKDEGRFEARVVTLGIESGEYTEILGGVKEGERVVISGQFLIDSEASLKASFTRMSPAEEPMASDMPMDDSSDAASAGEKMGGKMVRGIGVVKDLLPGSGKLTLQHEPIEALGWPSMTMDFKLDDSVDTRQLKVGDRIEFDLMERDERYLIEKIIRQGDGAAAEGSTAMEMKQ